MKIEILGSGGAITTPKPCCKCRVCMEARERGVPYSRTGPSYFIHSLNLLVDTPEEIKFQLNRSHIEAVDICFYTHWHPDHVMGRRVWEMHKDWGSNGKPTHCTRLLITGKVIEDFKSHLGTWEDLMFYERQGLVEIRTLGSSERALLKDIWLSVIALANGSMFGLQLDEAGKRVILIPDELEGWSPQPEHKGADLAILPMGICEINPLTGERNFPPNSPTLSSECTFEATLKIVKELKAKRTILSHIDEPEGLSYEDLCLLEAKLQGEGIPVEFAYDGMILEI